MKLKYFILCGTISMYLFADQDISTYFLKLNSDLVKTRDDFRTTYLENPIAPFQKMAQDLMSSTQQLQQVNNFFALFSQQRMMIYDIFKNYDGTIALSPEVISIVTSMNRLYPLYIPQNWTNIDKSLLKGKATLLFIHLFINTQIIPFIYYYEKEKEFRFDNNGFLILEGALQKIANLSQFRLNFPILIKEMLDQRDIQVLKPTIKLIKYILNNVLQPYLKKEALSQIENPLDMFDQYINEDIVIRNISNSLLNKIENKSKEFGIKEVIQWANPQTIQKIILKNIKEDYGNVPLDLYIKAPLNVPKPKEEPATWTGYWKKLF